VKKYIFIFFFSLILFFNTQAYAKFPVHLGGFTLGDDITNYSQLVNIGPCQKIIATPYIGEVKVLRTEFKSGLISYGLCDRPNKILKIKLKFADSSKKFFKKLLARYEKNIGPPSEYKGDSFQAMIAWKWSFQNKKKEKISLILQHNLVDEDQKIGTAVKLSLTSQIEKERACFMAEYPDKKKKRSLPQISHETMWDLFIPF
jgi:hypothetical protein